MAGTARTGFDSTKTPNPGPVHCSGYASLPGGRRNANGKTR
jgi:hypothetical protein